MAPMNIRILLIDNAVHRDIYKPFDHWSRYLPSEAEVIPVAKEEPLPRPDGFTHVLITGSEESILDPGPWVQGQVDFLREAAARKLPVLGSCHAHQMIALALAGPACVRNAPAPEFGWCEIRILEADPLFRDAVNPAWAFCSHFDEVVDLPDGFTVLASSERCGIHAFRVDGVPVYGIQSHPEITPEEGEGILADFPTRYPEMAKHSFSRPARDTGLVRTIVTNFLEMV
jgi:GMP synthase (glutamine-hydrolysing)